MPCALEMGGDDRLIEPIVEHVTWCERLKYIRICQGFEITLRTNYETFIR